jgi:hypothetical protein
MTRTDVMASSRPRTAGAALIRRGSSAGVRGLSTLVALLLALALAPGAAVAAEPTSGYTTTTTTPAATTPTTTPAKGTLPSKEAEKPASEPAPAKTPSPQSSTLPFTGFDLRWDVGFGLLLMAAGLSIVAVQRRQRRDRGR